MFEDNRSLSDSGTRQTDAQRFFEIGIEILLAVSLDTGRFDFGAMYDMVTGVAD